MKQTKDVWSICREAVRRYPSDVPKATKWARAQVAKMPDRAEVEEQLIVHGVQEIIQDVRHQSNRRIGVETGRYGGKPKIITGDNKLVKESAEAVINMYIAGTTLGRLYGEQLPEVAKEQREIGYGHLAVAELCEELVPIVPPGRTVGDSVSAKKCYDLWKKCQKRYEPKPTPKVLKAAPTNGRKRQARSKAKAGA